MHLESAQARTLTTTLGSRVGRRNGPVFSAIIPGVFADGRVSCIRLRRADKMCLVLEIAMRV